MEIVKDFFSGIKERFTSPFFISFVIVWVALNYSIVIPLIFYKHSEVRLDGYISYLDLIRNCYDSRNMFWIPLGWASVYSFVYPVAKGAIDSFQAYVVTQTDVFIFWLTKYKQAIRIEDHLKTTEELNAEKSKYSNLIQTSSATKKENELLIVQVKGLNERISEISESHSSELHRLNVENDALLKQQQAQESERVEQLRADYEGIIRNESLQLQEVSHNLANVSAQYSALKAEHQVQSERLGTALRKARDLQEESKKHQQIISELEARADRFEVTANSYDKKYKQVLADLEIKNTEQLTLMEKFEALKSQHSGLNIIFEGVQAANNHLSDELAQLKKINEEYQVERTAFFGEQQEIARLKGEESLLREELRFKNNEIEALKSQLNDFRGPRA